MANRTHGKIDHLPDEIRRRVHAWLLEGLIYEDIADLLRAEGFDISKSSVGRYGARFLNEVRRLKQVEDQAETLVSDAGDNPLVLEEALSKLISRDVIELMMDGKINIGKNPKLIQAVATLQRSSVGREKFKDDIRGKIKATAEEVETTLKAQGLSPEGAAKIKAQIMGITS